jgi:hypothetical protein
VWLRVDKIYNDWFLYGIFGEYVDPLSRENLYHSPGDFLYLLDPFGRHLLRLFYVLRSSGLFIAQSNTIIRVTLVKLIPDVSTFYLDTMMQDECSHTSH